MNSDFWEQFRHMLSKKRSGHPFRWRWVALVIGVLSSVGVYTYVINSVDPSNNFISGIIRYFKVPMYTFYSGGETGVYHQIANAAQSESGKGKTRFSIINKNSSGGAENAIKVLTTPRSFGLIQEEAVKKGGFVSKEIDFIAPLYLERTHIILKLPSSYNGNFSKKNPPRLSLFSDEEVLKLFAESNISIGPVGSGTRVIASYIISAVNEQIEAKKEKGELRLDKNKEQKIFNLSMLEGMERIKEEYPGDDKIDILFNIVGAPLKDIKDLLEKDNYMLISIDPSLVTQINKEYKLSLRLTDFKNSKAGGGGIYYPESKNISTVGSYAWLISSKDIPSSDILKVLGMIGDNKGEIAKNLKIELNSTTHFQLDEIDFYDFYKSQHERTNLGFWRSLLLFIGSFSVSTLLVFSFINFVVSLRKQSAYFQKIIIIQKNFPNNTDLNSDDYDYKTPKISRNQTEIIDRIILGIQGLMSLNREINQDFESGGITNNSFKFLVQNIEQTKVKFQKHLSRRITEVLESKHGNITQFMHIPYLRNFYTAGYLLEADFFRIKEALEQKLKVQNQASKETQ